MLIPINSDTIVAVIIEATTTDRKSFARRLHVSKMAPSKIRANSRDSREERHAHNAHAHTHAVYTIVGRVVVGTLEESRLAICGKADHPSGTGPHNGPRVLFCRPCEKKPENTMDFRVGLS
jgi:hypothetical protein